MADGDLVFVGDVHLDRDEPEVDAFVAYLRGLSGRARRIVLMGDLFNLWIGDASLEQDHHRRVLSCLRELRAVGVETHYLEGNRDYRIGKAHGGGAFDAVSAMGLREDWGGLRIWASHGDLVNVRDRQYRAWRAISRSGAAWALFSSIPRARRFAIAESIERKMRATNVRGKTHFPEQDVLSYAARRLGDRPGAVVLGHFHVERTLAAGGLQVFVLPEWKGSRRHLRVTADGKARFEDA